ncbi:unnamed protein product, partial [Allacma fusca]
QCTQGSYCGCKIGSSLTWDQESGECRRRVANECFYDKITSEDWKELPFNHKCRDRAECVNVNWTAITGRKNNDDNTFVSARVVMWHRRIFQNA